MVKSRVGGLLLSLMMGALTGCSDECVRNSDCSGGTVCASDGVCREPVTPVPVTDGDGGVDASDAGLDASDAGVDAIDADDAGADAIDGGADAPDGAMDAAMDGP